jgi:hypothetical protein
MASDSGDPERFRRRAMELRLECERIKARSQEAIRLTREAMRRSSSRLSSREPDPPSGNEPRG